jgi:cell division septal protein FtsQ
MNNQNRYSRAKGWLIICLTICVVSGSTFAAFFYYRFLREQRLRDPQFNIVAIAQSSSEEETLPTLYLAELLKLSYDKPLSLYAFDQEKGQRQLLASPLIKGAEIKKIKPGTLSIHYTPRKPIAFLGDCTNTALDREGVLFPFKPFFTPKKLPEICSGGSIPSWGQILQGPQIQLAFDLLQLSRYFLCEHKAWLRQVDVSRAYDLSYGRREIILVIEHRMDQQEQKRDNLYIEKRVLRLSTKNYKQELALYKGLSDYLDQQMTKTGKDAGGIVQRPTLIVDMRVPNLAFVKTSDYP